jgi:hypothetical protein
MSDDTLERAIQEIRNEAIDPAVVESAADRVWDKLQTAAGAPIMGCPGFQALFAAYREGGLPEGRALLVKDHLHECVACRKAYEAAGAKVMAMPAAGGSAAWRPYFRWAIAAALALAVGLTAFTVWNQTGAGKGGVTVQIADGALFRVAGQELARIKAGDQLPAGTEIRTAKSARAVLLVADGSAVEMNERTAVSVDATRRDTTIRLGYGKIIVQAAKRRAGHLYVATRDCRVAVTGTVFSVNSGLKGSRVSVIEGEVRVSQPGSQSVLRPGDQVATSASMTPVAVRDEIAWSRNAEQHMALLREFSALQRKIAEIPLPGVRYSSKLMGLLPAGTAVYAAIPNLGSFLGEADRIFRQRVQESPVLREWWQQKMEGKQGPALEEVIARIRGVSDFLGDEIVLAAVEDSAGKIGNPIFLAEVKRPGLREYLEKELHAPSDLKIVIEPDLVAFSPDPKLLDAIAARAGGFAATPFGQRLAAAYGDGVGLLFSADLERIAKLAPAKGKPQDRPALANLKYLIAEQKEVGGKTETRATLAFDGNRSGVASWLGAPAPIRALEFVSPDATVVAAAAMKSPAAVLDEAFSWMEKSNPGFRARLAETKAALGLKIRDDLAAPLGGEFAFALDGPPLPPSWKLAVEVYDAGRFKWAVEQLVQAVNREGARHGMKPVTLAQETSGGRTYFTVVAPEGKLVTQIHYTFVDGYLLAAPSRGLLDTAIQNRAAGYTLPRSAGFAALLPRDSHSDFSGIVYHNLASAAATVIELLPAEQQQALRQWAGEMKPALVAAYGEPDRITLASTGSILSLTANRFGLADVFGGNRRGTRSVKPAYR